MTIASIDIGSNTVLLLVAEYGREDLLLAGSLMLHTIMQKLRLENSTVSSKGLRYGAVIDYLMKNQLMNIER